MRCETITGRILMRACATHSLTCVTRGPVDEKQFETMDVG